MSLHIETRPTAAPATLARLPDSVLADMIGDADMAAKEEQAYLDSLKDEAKRRGCEMATGSRFKFTVTLAETSRLDTKGLKALLGDALDPYYKKSASKTLRISSVFEAPALD